MSSSSWLVTGAAGFLGSHVVEHLLANNIPVVAVDNLTTGSAQFLEPFTTNPRFRFVLADIRDQKALSEICQREKIEALVHLVALHFIPDAVRDPDSAINLNI